MSDKERLQSVLNALSILETLSSSDGEMGVTQLSQQLKLGKSKIHRLLATLHERGYVEQNSVTSRYRLGLKVFELGFSYLSGLDLYKVAWPTLEEISRFTEETTHLAVMDSTGLVFIGRIESPKAVGVSTRVGAHSPIHCTATGKVLLAHQPAQVIDAVIAKGLNRRTEATFVDESAFREELARIRTADYALDRGELEPELQCIAVPVRNHLGQAIASIGISGPAYRLTMERIESLVDFMKQSALRVSVQLGYKPSVSGNAV
ncbi:MAG: IclR family transcriptional regulator [Chloroflexi bacterium]|nr:IclR family transcriptional regulator [Chloroflexota bacterium]